MTDRDLAEAFSHASLLEQSARAYWERTPAEDLAERDAALVAVRLATPLRRQLQQWMAARVCRAALKTSARGGSDGGR
jgi:hypothetical protein